MKKWKCMKVALTLAFLIFILTSISFNSVVAASNWRVEEGQTIEWEVVKCMKDLLWWWDPNTGFVKVNISARDTITLTFTNVTEEEAYTNFTIGNLTVQNVDLTTIGFNLAIGFWPFSLSLVVQPVWDNITKAARENNMQIIEENASAVYLGLPRHVIIFGNETVDGNKFYLVYDKVSGVLLEGYSKYMGYELEIKIKSTDVQLGVSEAYEMGYEEGFEAGNETGYKTGFEEGWAEGYVKGRYIGLLTGGFSGIFVGLVLMYIVTKIRKRP